MGGVVHALWSVAGDSDAPELGHVIVEPLIELRLPGHVSLFTNNEMAFYWKGGESTVPINFGVGHDFNGHFVGQLQVAYTFAGQGKGSVQAVVALNFEP